MSETFKKVLATISLIVVIPFSILAYFGMMYSQAWGGSCDLQCNTLRLLGFLGPITLVFYVMFLKKRKDIFLWLTVIPLFVVVLYIATSGI